MGACKQSKASPGTGITVRPQEAVSRQSAFKVMYLLMKSHAAWAKRSSYFLCGEQLAHAPPNLARQVRKLSLANLRILFLSLYTKGAYRSIQLKSWQTSCTFVQRAIPCLNLPYTAFEKGT